MSAVGGVCGGWGYVMISQGAYEGYVEGGWEKKGRVVDNGGE